MGERKQHLEEGPNIGLIRERDEALAALRLIASGQHPAQTTFKLYAQGVACAALPADPEGGIPIQTDESMPDDEIAVVSGGEEVGRITNIGPPQPEQDEYCENCKFGMSERPCPNCERQPEQEPKAWMCGVCFFATGDADEANEHAGRLPSHGEPLRAYFQPVESDRERLVADGVLDALESLAHFLTHNDHPTAAEIDDAATVACEARDELRARAAAPQASTPDPQDAYVRGVQDGIKQGVKLATPDPQEPNGD